MDPASPLQGATRVAIVGNAGSGKSSLARWIAGRAKVPVLDLDTIFWEPDRIAVKRDPARVLNDLEGFCRADGGWVVEGCYGTLIEATLDQRPRLIFLDPGKESCLRNCRARPWEPHKYASPHEQDAQLHTLLAWVTAYYERDDDMSHAGHAALFDRYQGPKERLTQVPAGALA